MPTKQERNEALELLGASPEEISRELAEFRESAKALSSDHPGLIDAYPQQWVGIFHGKVAAQGKTLKSLMAGLEKKGIPPEQALIRFIERNERTFIL